MYDMCELQPAQLDCRVELCKFYAGAGICKNKAPAITLHPDKSFVCWSRKIRKHKIVFSIGRLKEDGKHHPGYRCKFCEKSFSGDRQGAKKSAKDDPCWGDRYAR